MDIWHKITNWVDHNRWLVLGLALAVAVPGFVGCWQPKAISPVTGEPVNMEVFRAETITHEAALAVELTAVEQKIEAYFAKCEVAEQSFTDQYELQERILTLTGNVATAIATGGISAVTADPALLITSLIGLGIGAGGTGAIVDKRRANKLLAKKTTKSS